MNVSYPKNRIPLLIVLGVSLAVALPLAFANGLVRAVWANSDTINASTSAPSAAVPAELADRYGKLPLSFEANQGQTDPQVKFLSRGRGYDLFLTATAAVLTLRKPQSPPPDKLSASALANKDISNASLRETSVLRLKMIGANSGARVEGQDELPGKVNYLIGDDPEKWHANVPTYRRVHYTEIYPGIDMVYYGNQRQLEYDFVVAPHADPRALKFNLEGAQDLRIDGRGDLVITIDHSEVRLRKPVIYQITDQGKQNEVSGSYQLKGSQVSFSVKDYDSKKALIIDPVLSYSSYFGPGANAVAITVDASGNAYLTGTAASANFPTTTGSLKTNGSQDVPDAFVTKLNSTGTALVYSTFLGGSSQDAGSAIAVDSAGNAYVTGNTSSDNFPLVSPLKTKGSFFKTTDAAANWNNINTGLSGDVNALAVAPNMPNTIYAGTFSGPYLSTNGGATWQKTPTAGLPVNMAMTYIAVDSTNASVVYAGMLTGGLYKTTNGGSNWSPVTVALNGATVFSIVFDPVTPSVIYLGSGNGVFRSTDNGSNWTQLNNFGIPGTPNVRALAIDPTTPATIYAGTFGSGLFKTTNGGSSWTAMNNGMSGTFANYVNAIAIDPLNPATVYAGHGYSTTGGSIDKTTNGGSNWSPVNTGVPNYEVRALIIDRLVSSTVYAATTGGGVIKTTNGGSSWAIANAGLWKANILSLVSDPTNSSVLYAGTGSSSNEVDAFVSELNPSGSALLFSTYLGGSTSDYGYGIALDASGKVYLAGQTNSPNFPAVNAIKSTLNPSDTCTDGFVTKLNLAGPSFVYSTYLGGTGCDTAYAVGTDSSGNAYVTGTTSSTNFPVANAFQSTLADQSFGSDAFATKFNANGTLGYSTYLGGNGTDTGYGIAVDSSGNAYITGTSNSTNFPTLNPILSTNLGGFVTKLNNLGSGLVYSTYLGNSRGIAVDSGGNAYVTGFTNSTDFPVVAGALQTRSPFYKSSNSGGNWGNENYGLKGGGLTCLAIDPVTPSTLYAGTGAGGVYKSTDGGKNWSAINNGLGNLRITEIVIDPITPANLFAASYDTSASGTDGVYKSTNGGNSWARVINGMSNTSVMSLAIDPLTPATLYAGPYGGPIYKTTNAAGNWAPSGNPSISFPVCIAIDPVTPTTLFAADVMSGGGIFKSIDAGVTWQSVGFAQTGPYGSFVAVSPLNHSKIFAVSNSGLFKSVDGGANWTLVGPYAFSKVVYDPVNSSTIYLVNTSQGILRSTDDGQSWTPINKGFKSTAAIALKINPANPSTFYAAIASSGDNDAFVTKINQSGTAFVYSTLLGGSPPPGDSSNLNDEAYGIAVDPSGNAYVTGSTRSLDFPTTPDAYLPVPVGSSFVSKLTMSYLISGQVLDGSNAPVSGAEVTLSDGTSLSSIITESDGSYQFSHLREGGSFTVSAAKPLFTMTPASQTFNNLNSNQTLNFIATATNAPFYSIGGTVTNNGVGLSGVTLTLGGSQAGLRTTDSNGNYSFTLAGGGSYTVTPALLGFSFSPPSQTFNSLGADQTADFIATRQSFVVTNANNHGVGSLRQAMLDASATLGTDTIVFNIAGAGVHTINLLIPLPQITDPVVIDATTQPGYAGTPLVELNGALAGNSGSGFAIAAGGSTIRGFAIGGFTSNSGIALSGNGNNVIQGNYIGIDPTGTLRRANNTGITLSGSSNNLIGGTTPAARNVISSNNFQGISMTGSSNQISGNFIGTNAAGTAALGNGINGIEVFNVSGPLSANNVIGGTAAGAGNLISGNQRGISMSSSGALIQGNLIGTDVSGTLAIGNGTGIQNYSPGLIVGGTVPGARNVISGNTGDGITIGGAGSRLEGNFIGTDITGTVALGNGGSGVVAGNGCLIGGTNPQARNVISGNGLGGFGNISLGSNSSGTQATVQGNYIGTDVTGNVALNNPQAGISISGSGNLIGGLVPGAQNVISGNRIGIQVGGSVAPGPVNNTIQGNLIGFNALGTAPLPNSNGGINVSDSSNNVIGGTQNGAGNKISFSGGPGIIIFSGTGNVVRGNSIFSNLGLGMDLSPTGITANDTSDADSGANNLQNFPVLTAVTPNGGGTTIQGTLNSTPNTGFQIDFYSNAACHASGNGEGARFFDTTNVTTDANGNAAINFASSQVLASGRVITATATDPAGNTSEFSACDSGSTTGSVQFSNAVYNVLEDVGNVTITVLRTGGSNGMLSVNYSTSDLTATAGSDYTAVSGTLVFANGETSKSFAIPIANDGVAEPLETLRVAFTGVTDLETLGSQGTATVNIQDNNTPLVLSLNNTDVTEGNSGTTNAVVTVTLSAATGRTVTADYSAVSGTAINGVDFTLVPGSLSFAPGVTVRTINVTIVGDTLNEATEFFQVVLTNPTNASIANSAVVQIINDDPLPSLSIGDVSVTEGTSGTVNAVFNVSLSTASGRGLSVGYATANGTATSGSDYVTTSGRVNFSAGETLKTITVLVNGDTAIEPAETFFVNLSAPSNATIADNQGLGTILNDDGTGGSISFSLSNYSVGESGGQTTITVNRAGALSSSATVNYATSEAVGQSTLPCAAVNGAASSRCDFTTAQGTLRFAAGESSKTFAVLISQDNFVEGSESLTLVLSNPTGGALLTTPSSSTLTITDDPTEPPTNPVEDAEVFVRQHYHDFLNREPDASGLDFWKNQITECQQPGATCSAEVRRINVSAAFFLSIEFQETGYLVERLYKVAYGDATGVSTLGGPHQLPVPIIRFNAFLSDTQAIGLGVVVGQPGWEQVLETNKQNFTAEFVQRSTFTTAYPATMTPAQFVDTLNTNAGNPLSPTERNQLVSDLTNGVTTRAQVLRAVAEDSDLNTAEKNRAFVLMQFFGYLRRNPDDLPDSDYTGYDFWLGKLNQFNGNFVNAEMVKAFILSGEYRQRFGP